MNNPDATPEGNEENVCSFKYRVSEEGPMRSSIFHAGFLRYAEAKEYARQKSERGRGRAFRIFDLDGSALAIVLDGKVTNAAGAGPDVDPEV
jgi:hypothetical protein